MKREIKFNKECLKASLLVLFIIVCTSTVNAQKVIMQQKQTGKTTFIMPDGSVLPAEKMDSLTNAWGRDRISFRHSSADDEKGIVHLVRMTDEMVKMRAEAEAERQGAMKALIGTNAPDFTLKDMDGKSWQLSALKGKVVVINFWFTSCMPCIGEMPQLNSVVDKYKGKDVVFLALTFNYTKDVTAFLKNHSFAYTILPESQEVNEKYGITAFPTSLLINRKGIITNTVDSGPHVDSELSKAIDAAL